LTSLPKPDLDKLSEFVRGKLSTEESSVILDHLEKDPELARDFEFVLALLNISKEEWEGIRKSRSTR